MEIPKEGFAFITSPADIDVHRKVELKNAEVSEEDRKAFEEICKRYEDVFSVDSTDIGKYPPHENGYRDRGQPTYLSETLQFTIKTC